MNVKTPFSLDDEFSPRNPWVRARRALGLVQRGRYYDARRVLEDLRYHPAVSDSLFEVFARQVDRGEAGSAPLINIPADYLMHQELGFRAPFRRIEAGRSAPPPYPPGMALPPLVGVGNDHRFLKDAATVLAPRLGHRLRRAHVFVAMTEMTDLPALLRALAGQSYGGGIAVTVFGATEPATPVPDRLDLECIADGILEERGGARLAELLAGDEDILAVFLGGAVTLDPTALERAAHWARVTDSLVQPLVEGRQDAPLRTVFDEGVRHELFGGRYPFRDMQGLNFIAPSGLLRDVGLPDSRFTSTCLAARELAFRMFLKGKYFAPLQVPGLAVPADDKPAPEAEKRLYAGLCPNRWDRPDDGQYERPYVSVYIPAYNASNYITRAVDSVLEQDFEDLEVCICNDGSTDDTADILQRAYGDLPRVRWVNRRNGGIGFGSNAAIHLSRGLYVGQLDSDDALKPGAVRRLATYLDENPQVSCVYGSCERIDPEGAYIKDEYRWPQFSREKMMVTSIAHHFRMFRRAAWERTAKFREDIVNGIDYDIFLKLSETGPFHHIDEILYQRRWHGGNTSMVNEGHQTANTHRVQNETLKRLGLDRFWEVHVPDPEEPRRITYRRRKGTRTVLFWPDYSRSNPYQHMLYREARKSCEICAGDIDAALEVVREAETPADVTFHLHWLNFLFKDAGDEAEARQAAEDFLEKIDKFTWLGGRLVWTIHNHVSHDTPFPDLEARVSARIAAAAHALHFHSEASVAEVEEVFEVPRDKVVISPHGHYIGAYPDFVTRETARAQLGIDEGDRVILFTGQLRPYKGIEQLIAAFRALLPERPELRLLIAGEMKHDPFAELSPPLSEAERARISATGRFVSDMEMQLFLRAADVAVYPYQKILTSGSLLLALSFDLPVVIPDVGMTREVAERTRGSRVYDGAGGADALREALRDCLDRGRGDTGPATGPETGPETGVGFDPEVFEWPDLERSLLSWE